MSAKAIRILGIESSCDETAAAVVEDGKRVLSDVIASQIDVHAVYGGVVPEIASRKHTECISQVVAEALDKAKMTASDLDYIAVTKGPGLVGALLVGVSYAKGLSYASKKPLLAVNHIEAHIGANFIENDIEPPFVCLVASGGHTHLVVVKNGFNGFEYEVCGRTKDDAAGEAFDKVARALGLGYPGGPLIDKLAGTGDSQAINFPRANVTGYDFSFSGVKSAVLNYLNKCNMQNTEYNKADVAASFQAALIDVLTTNSVKLCKDLGLNKLALAGGVSVNSSLRSAMQDICDKSGIRLYIPSPRYCTDNAVMIASSAYFTRTPAGLDLNAIPNIYF